MGVDDTTQHDIQNYDQDEAMNNSEPPYTHDPDAFTDDEVPTCEETPTMLTCEETISEEEPHDPWHGFEESKEERSFDDDGDEDNTMTLSFEMGNPLPQPTLPKLFLAKEMIDNIKAMCLEDDLDEEMLVRLRSPPRGT